MNDLGILNQQYFELLERQQFDSSMLDVSILERHKHMLQYMSTVENTAITIFDLNKKQHVFSSYNFNTLLGYDMDAIEREGNDYFNSRVHPEDLVQLLKNGIAMFSFFYELPTKDRCNYKLINEYRILKGEGNYVRVIEQHQALELDSQGNVWLALGVMDISPNQDVEAGMRSQLVNFRTGEIVPFKDLKDSGAQPQLTNREREVLKLMKEGHLSKEISGMLSISVHTVNTHRQRILEKLNANNTIEALKYAADLGLAG